MTVRTGYSITVARRDNTLWLLAVGLSALPAAALFVAPLSTALHALLFMVFSPTCHQLAERSFFSGGLQMAVCHRCTGIYAAIPAGAALLFPLSRHGAFIRRHTPLLVAISLLPMAVDWGLEASGIWSNTAVSRVLTGAIFGLLAGVLFAGALGRPIAERMQGG